MLLPRVPVSTLEVSLAKACDPPNIRLSWATGEKGTGEGKGEGVSRES